MNFRDIRRGFMIKIHIELSIFEYQRRSNTEPEESINNNRLPNYHIHFTINRR